MSLAVGRAIVPSGVVTAERNGANKTGIDPGWTERWQVSSGFDVGVQMGEGRRGPVAPKAAVTAERGAQTPRMRSPVDVATHANRTGTTAAAVSKRIRLRALAYRR